MARSLRRRVLLLVTALLGVVGGLTAGFVALDHYLDPFDDRPFDPAAWAEAKEHEKERGRMARDAARRLPAGTPTERVRALLGKPDEAISGNPPDKWGRRIKGYTRWSYSLGCWSGLGWYGFDAADLDVYFDREGRVVETEITGG
jgi:hypothetical protein